ncbi:MAG: sulfotransferase family 2 domain-containing protein [Planctomycetota bacterium]
MLSTVVRNIIRKPRTLLEVNRKLRLKLAMSGRSSRSVPVFLHVPKTGGTYLSRVHNAGRPVLWPLRYLGHALIGSADGHHGPLMTETPWVWSKFITKKDLRRNFVFSVCRNPFDLLVSYRAHASKYDPAVTGEGSHDFDASHGDFGDFVKRLADRECPWPNRRMLHFQMFADDGEFVVDWVFRNESLDDDAEALANHLGVEYSRLERLRTGRGNRPKDYREMYTDSLVDLVERTWGDDLALFGYDFESGPVEGQGLHGPIDDDRRRSIRYDRGRGLVRVGGEPIRGSVPTAFG